MIPDLSDVDFICGGDECGYGSLAGELVTCSVVVPKDWELAHLVKDSKALSRSQREAICKKLVAADVVSCIVSVSPSEIDSKGVYPCLLAAHREAIDGALAKHALKGLPGSIKVIVNGTLNIPGTISLPKADALIPAVSAASIIGKVWHDLRMIELDKEYPGYGLAQHMGYGTKKHLDSLKKLGPTPIHRKSYAPIASLLPKAYDSEVEVWKLFED